MKYFKFKMFDNLQIMDQVRELQVMVSKLSKLEVKILDSLHVEVILSKFPTTWSDYRKKVLHSTESFTIKKFQTHLEIDAESRTRDISVINSKLVRPILAKLVIKRLKIV